MILHFGPVFIKPTCFLRHLFFALDLNELILSGETSCHLMQFVRPLWQHAKRKLTFPFHGNTHQSFAAFSIFEYLTALISTLLLLPGGGENSHGVPDREEAAEGAQSGGVHHQFY